MLVKFIEKNRINHVRVKKMFTRRKTRKKLNSLFSQKSYRKLDTMKYIAEESK